MLCIAFLFEFMNLLLNIKIFFYKYSRVPVDINKICGYSHNGYPHGADIYLVGRVRGSYYLYPTRPVDIPTYYWAKKLN